MNMGEFVRALLSIRSTHWRKAIEPSQRPARSATLLADPFAYLVLSILSPEARDKVLPQSKQLFSYSKQDQPGLNEMNERGASLRPRIDSFAPTHIRKLREARLKP